MGFSPESPTRSVPCPRCRASRACGSAHAGGRRHKFVFAVDPHDRRRLRLRERHGVDQDLSEINTIAVDKKVAEKNGWRSARHPRDVRQRDHADEDRRAHRRHQGAVELGHVDRHLREPLCRPVRLAGVHQAEPRCRHRCVRSGRRQDPARLPDGAAADTGRVQGMGRGPGQPDRQIIYALLFLAIIIALLGIANTLALSIYERRHEIGLLRAVGMTRRQVRSAVRWEAVIIALLGTGLGLVIGVAFGAAIVRSLAIIGFTGFAIPVGQLVVVAILAADRGSRRGDPARPQGGEAQHPRVDRDGVGVAGYSGTPLVKKLGIKDGAEVVTLAAPEGFADLVAGVPIIAATRAHDVADVIVAFFTKRADLAKRIEGCGKAIFPDGGSGSRGRRRRPAWRRTSPRTPCERSRFPSGSSTTRCARSTRCGPDCGSSGGATAAADSMSASLVAHALRFRRADAVILDGVSVTIGPGTRRSAWSAPTGAGKSTLLRVLAGELPDGAGTVQLAARPRPSATSRRSPSAGRRDGARATSHRRTGVDATPNTPSTPPPMRSPRTPGRRRPLRGRPRTVARARRRRLRRARRRDPAPTSGCRRDAARPAHARCRAGRPRGRRWRRSCSRASTCSCSTSRPTTSTSPGSTRLERFVAELAGRRGDRVARPRLPRADGHVACSRSTSTTRTARSSRGGWLAYLEERATARRHAEEAYAEYTAQARRARRPRPGAAAVGGRQGVRKVKRKPRDTTRTSARFRIAASEKQASKVQDRPSRRSSGSTSVDKPWEGWELRFEIAAAPAQRRRSSFRLDGAVIERGDVPARAASTSRSAGPSASRSSGRTAAARRRCSTRCSAGCRSRRASGGWVPAWSWASSTRRGAALDGAEPLLDAFSRRERAARRRKLAPCSPSSGSVPTDVERSGAAAVAR